MEENEKILPSPVVFWGRTSREEFTLGRRLEKALQALDGLPGDRDTLFFWLYGCVYGSETQISHAHARSCGSFCGSEALRTIENFSSADSTYRGYAEELMGEPVPHREKEPLKFARYALEFADEYLESKYCDWCYELCEKFDRKLNSGYLCYLVADRYRDELPDPAPFEALHSLLRQYLLPTTLWQEFLAGYREATVSLLRQRIALECPQQNLDIFERMWFPQPPDVEPD